MYPDGAGEPETCIPFARTSSLQSKMSTKDSDSVGIDEKDNVLIEQRSSPGFIEATDGELLNADIRPSAERKLVRLLDMRLLPTIIVIFLLNYIDRVAVTAAKLQGLTQDLHLTGLQYNTVIAVLYATYVPAQIPSNMILNRISR